MKLSLQGVVKEFGEHRVLDGIDLDVPLGAAITLIGASGSGKSTLLRCINLLEQIDDGAILLDGFDISAPGLDPNPIRRRVGMVFQSFNLFPHKTVLGNIMLAPRKLNLGSDAERRERAMDLLGRLGLAEKADDYPDRLSGGQQQRVAIARSLAMGPEVMLLDEITSALDPELVGEVLDVVRGLRRDRAAFLSAVQPSGEASAGPPRTRTEPDAVPERHGQHRGMTMVLATHEMTFAREISDTVCFLDAGRIVESGPPDQLFGNPREDRTRQFLQRVTAAGRL